MAYSTSWKATETALGAQEISETSSTLRHPLGTRVRARDVGDNQNGAGEFVYVKGVANGSRGDWATINQDDHSTTLLVADAIGPVGVFMADLSASTLYGWAQIYGKAVGKALTGYADDAAVYATSTDGSVDDTAVAGDLVHGAKGASDLDIPEAGMAEFELSYPYTDNDVDDLDVS